MIDEYLPGPVLLRYISRKIPAASGCARAGSAWHCLPTSNEVQLHGATSIGVLKLPDHPVVQAKRRSGAIAEVVNAYAAGLGYRPSTKPPKKRAILQATPEMGAGASGGGDDDDVDTVSEATDATGAPSASVAVSATSSLSSSSKPNPATDWWTDGGVSNRWAMGNAVRKKLFLALQAGAVAHMSLKQRRAAEKPWVKVKTVLKSKGHRSWGLGGAGNDVS